MKGRRGRRDDDSISFFAFQDVMISITGIILVVALLLLMLRKTGLELEHAILATDSEVPDETRVVVTQIREMEGVERSRIRARKMELQFDLDSMEAVLENIEARLWLTLNDAEMTGDMAAISNLLRRRDELMDSVAQMTRRNRIVYLISDPEGRSPWIVELRDDRIILSTDRAEEAPISLHVKDSSAVAEQLLDFFESLPDRSERYLLLSVKPSGVALLADIIDAVERRSSVSRNELGLDLIPEWASTTDLFPGRRR
jgi:hypothetical protein